MDMTLSDKSVWVWLGVLSITVGLNKLHLISNSTVCVVFLGWFLWLAFHNWDDFLNGVFSITTWLLIAGSVGLAVYAIYTGNYLAIGAGLITLLFIALIR